MQRESDSEFQHRMLDTMRGVGFVIPPSIAISEGKWFRVPDGPDDSGKAGAFKFDRSRNGNLVCSYRSFKRDIPADHKKGDLAYEFARGGFDKPRNAVPPAPFKPPTLAERLTLSPEHRAEMRKAVEAALKEWDAGSVVKAGEHAYLSNPDLYGSAVRQSRSGALIAPVLRPTPDLQSVEWAGGQTIHKDGGKYFVTGTKALGAFSLVPAVKDPNRWMEHLEASPKPLILCEGIGTAMAIHQATGYPVIACLSAKNLPVVAEWLKASGYAARRDVIVFADNDLAHPTHPESGYIGIREATKAAEILGGRVAVANNGQKGYDARDLYRDHGYQAVVDHLEESMFPDEVRQHRPEAFSLPGQAPVIHGPTEEREHEVER